MDKLTQNIEKLVDKLNIGQEIQLKIMFDDVYGTPCHYMGMAFDARKDAEDELARLIKRPRGKQNIRIVPFILTSA